MNQKPTVLVILGPTASGKSTLGVDLAKKYKGEIISADSRQVYRGLDIGSGKITKKEMRGVPHHLLDVANPKHTFSAAQYQKLARQKIAEILARGKLPIIVGGTGFYIQAVVDNLDLPRVPPNPKLRASLGKKNTKQLFKILQKLDPKRAKNIDANNPHRLIRAIEIAQTLGKVPKLTNPQGQLKYNFIQIGIKASPEKLRQNIHRRLFARIRDGLVAEVRKLHKQGVSWKRLDELGLEYRYISRYLREDQSKFGVASELVSRRVKREKFALVVAQLEVAINQYAKRQMTWFKRDQRIQWVDPRQANKLGNLRLSAGRAQKPSRPSVAVK